jgi:acetylornithine deacetylase
MSTSTQHLTDGAVSLLKDLIAIPFFSRQEDKTADCIEAFLPRQGHSLHAPATQRMGPYNRFFDPAKPTVLLNSHHDTVNPTVVGRWTRYGRWCRRASCTAWAATTPGVPGILYGLPFCHFYRPAGPALQPGNGRYGEEEVSGT